MKFNFVNNIDAYKIGHKDQYPDGLQEVLSNLTARGSRLEGINEVVFFGLQAFLDDLQESFEEFLASDVDEVCAAYEKNITEILGPNSVGSLHIRELHELGYLPLEFCALPEGARVNLKVPLFTMRNTDARFGWLVNYLETWISAQIWLASTSATTAAQFRGLLESWAEETGSPIESVDFQAHDFSMRGMSSLEAAAASGAGHLLSFLGSDVLPAKDWVKRHYDAQEPILLSVPATEHSVMCAGGNETELETYDRLLDLYTNDDPNTPDGIVSVVSDTWDLWKVITKILPQLKEKILGRDGKLVIRPDSGDPADILCGLNSNANYLWDTKGTLVGSPEEKGVIELLWEIFGGTINEKGFKVLDPHIGAIYGDSITNDRADDICRRLAAKGFASCNVVFGIGSYTYQYKTRDSLMFAVKATNVVINGEDIAIFKDPITDSGTKRSARGHLAVHYELEQGFYLVDNLTRDQVASEENWLAPVWVNGKFLQRYTFDQVKWNTKAIIPAHPSVQYIIDGVKV